MRLHCALRGCVRTPLHAKRPNDCKLEGSQRQASLHETPLDSIPNIVRWRRARANAAGTTVVKYSDPVLQRPQVLKLELLGANSVYICYTRRPLSTP